MTPPSAPGREERGIALLIVMMVITLLAALVVEFSYNTSVSAELTGNLRDSLQADALARVGVEVGKALLIEDLKDEATRRYQADYVQSGWDNPEEELWSRIGSVPLPVEDWGVVSATIEDENRRINLNRLVDANKLVADNVAGMLQRLLQSVGEQNQSQNPAQAPGVPPGRLPPARPLPNTLDPATLVDALRRWIDPTACASDEAAYQSLPHPYSCRGGPLASLSEFALVKGVGRNLLESLAPYVTFCGDGTINLNTAQDKVLLALTDGMTDSMVQEILEKRKENPFMNTAASGVAEINKNPLLSVTSDCFTITSQAEVNGVVRTAVAVVLRDRGLQKIKKLVYWKVY